ncbi:MAG: BREX-3 system phosphatase PglZ [Gammaproteobacteria bacterium]|nr:BREX-3 system phosphatase PglZ [Gammaproteobacteria bacterium]MBU0849351.1 BREX-3 system phosphatase PglZ [Gammaproteobacteria bacterium]MBU1779628.1 BREX-3 system phosphatase PglZ [Gammaproteobacteria bacterium]MBU2088528.1 BREX-3 system phosphatase PglZ [Gammaproteobacteria bacterium]MBU2128508.1 BREX-3 system phosphatase PglZ [Gammaproteobacteria bacterium]
MSQWSERILSHFTADLTRLWVACDPDDVLLDEKLLSELRSRGFEVMLYEDPFAFRAEYEERYRAAWDRGEPGPAPSLILHLRSADANTLPWDIVHHGRVVRLSLAELFPRLAYSAVQQVEPEHFARLFHAHQTELQTARGEHESKDFILEHVFQLSPRSIRNPVDFWRELLRIHFANRSLPPLFVEHAARIIQGKGLFPDLPVATWLASKRALLQVVQDAWRRYLSELGLNGSFADELFLPYHIAKLEIPFDHSDLQILVDSMFLDGSLHPLAVASVPAKMPSWIKAGIVQDPAALQALILKGLDGLIESTPTVSSSHKEWSEFAKRYGEILARIHGLRGTGDSEHLSNITERIKALQVQSDESLRAWVAAKHYADLILQPVTKGPVMLHHVPRFLRHRRSAGETKVALLVFDGLAIDQWVQIREHLTAASKGLTFEEGTAFAWLPTVTSVSRQALFSGLKPREFEDSIDRTDKEESLWKMFWQNEGVSSNEVMYRRALRQTNQLDALEADLIDRRPKVVGLVIDEVDDRLHKERFKKDVAMWIGNWLKTGFVDRLFSLLLDKGYHIYLTADHGNVESTGVGRPSQGMIAEMRGERVRVYRSEPLLADSATAYPNTVRLDIAGLPANFMPLFAGGRTAFVPEGEEVVVHGGVSIEELIVPFVKISYSGDVA